MSAQVCKVTDCGRPAESGSLCDTHAIVADDQLITRASVPNAAALLRQATQRGFISPVSGYGGGQAAFAPGA